LRGVIGIFRAGIILCEICLTIDNSNYADIVDLRHKGF